VGRLTMTATGKVRRDALHDRAQEITDHLG